MWQEERGSVIAFALLVIVVFTTMIAGISSLVISETRAVRSEIEETKAAYAAEAGIEKAIYDLKNDNLDDKWTKVADDHYKLNSQNLFSGSNVNHSVEIKKLAGGNDLYEIEAKGSAGDLDQKIVTHVKYNDMFAEPVTSGGNIDSDFSGSIFGIDFSFEIPVYNQDGAKIEAETREIADEDIPDVNFNADDHKNGLSDKYFPNQAAFESSEYYSSSSSGWWIFRDIFKDDELSLPPGQMVYVDSDLSIGYDRITSSDPDNPAVVVVNGNLDFGEIRNKIKNVYFLVNGDYRMAGAGLDASNTLIYTTGSINFTKDLHYDYQGALVSKGDIDLIADNLFGVGTSISSEVRAEKINTNVFSRAMKDKTGLEPVMISWQEN